MEQDPCGRPSTAHFVYKSFMDRFHYSLDPRARPTFQAQDSKDYLNGIVHLMCTPSCIEVRVTERYSD